MGKRLDVTLLVGAAEIAARLGLSRPQIVHTWRRRYPDFPEPVLVLDMGHLWYWPAVEAWAKRSGRA
jgi:predicted DNA-binding transcriptional regulator AlpA